MADIVEAEASEKLDRNVGIDLSTLFAAHIMGQARAYGSLVNAGMESGSTASICSLQVD